MQLTDAASDGRPFIQGYGPGGFRIDDKRMEGSALVLPTRAVDWPVRDVAALSLDDLDAVIGAADDIDVLLIGCGDVAVLPPRAVRDGLRTAGIVPEPMDTGAACRTYNVLVAEGRQVAAALVAI